MPEAHSSTPEVMELPDALYDLKRGWAGLRFPQKVVAIGKIWDDEKSKTGKEEFITNASGILQCGITALKAMLETYEEYGEAVLMDSGQEKEPLPKTEPQPRDQKSKTEATNRKSALTNLLHEPLLDEDAKVVYKELKEDWVDWSILRRSVQLRRLFRFELDHTPDDEARIFDTFCRKFDFLSREEITGYLELTMQSAGLKSIVNKDILSEDAVGLIGEMRSEFGDLFDSKRLGSELERIAGNKKNLDENGLLKIEAIEAVRDHLRKIVNRLLDMGFGEAYVIDPQSSYKEEYKGVSDEQFELVPPDDPIFAEYHRRQNPPAEMVLCRNKKQRYRVIFIDCRALCKPSDVKT